jgi:hypothetical protein
MIKQHAIIYLTFQVPDVEALAERLRSCLEVQNTELTYIEAIVLIFVVIGGTLCLL